MQVTYTVSGWYKDEWQFEETDLTLKEMEEWVLWYERRGYDLLVDRVTHENR